MLMLWAKNQFEKTGLKCSSYCKLVTFKLPRLWNDFEFRNNEDLEKAKNLYENMNFLENYEQKSKLMARIQMAITIGNVD